MAQFNKIQTLQAIIQVRMMPAYYGREVEIAKQVVETCYEGGVKAFEPTNRGGFTHEIFGELVEYVAKGCPELVLGVGSIANPITAASFVQLDANFVVGPLFDPEIVKICNRRLVSYTSSCGSASGTGLTQEVGCDLCKMLPVGSVRGSLFVKNIKAPMPWTLAMATDAVEPAEENLSVWFKTGVTCIGMGSKLFPKEAIAGSGWQFITDLCRSTLSITQRYRQV